MLAEHFNVGVLLISVVISIHFHVSHLKITNLKSRENMTSLTSHSGAFLFCSFHHLLFFLFFCVCVWRGGAERCSVTLIHDYNLKLQMYNNSNKPSAVYRLVAASVFTFPAHVGFNHCVLSNQACTRCSDQ